MSIELCVYLDSDVKEPR